MKLAYIIQAHKGFKQLNILIDILSKNSDVYLHIDLKNDYLYNRLKDHYLSQKNIFILSDRISVNWSGFSQIEATLNLLEAARGKNYDYITLLSGQDLPIKSHSEIIKFLCYEGMVVSPSVRYWKKPTNGAPAWKNHVKYTT